MFCIRGATTVLEDNKEEVLEATKDLLEQIISKNGIETEDIISIIFTATKDLKSVYPAVSARQLGITEAGLMCFQELYVEGSLPKCIRVMLNINADKKQKEAKHIYLKEAKKLRPDILE